MPLEASYTAGSNLLPDVKYSRAAGGSVVSLTRTFRIGMME